MIQPAGCRVILIASVWFQLSACASMQSTVPIGTSGGRVHSRFKGRALVLHDVPPGKPQTLYHQVQKGDTLWALAKQYKVSLGSIRKENKLKKGDSLSVGQRLKITTRLAAVAKEIKEQEDKARVRKTTYPLRWPLKGVITARFGHKRGKAHDGIDISAKEGTLKSEQENQERLNKELEHLEIPFESLRRMSQLPTTDRHEVAPQQELLMSGTNSTILRHRVLDLYQDLETTGALIFNAGEEIQKTVERLRYTPSIRPADTTWTTSYFGRRIDPMSGHWVMHKGMDLGGYTGMKIFAPAAGTVIWTGSRGGYGKTVVLDHGMGLQTHYAHLHRYHVSVGDQIRRGELIAEMGNTGKSTGPHLHYEVRKLGQPLDPLNFILD